MHYGVDCSNVCDSFELFGDVCVDWDKMLAVRTPMGVELNQPNSSFDFTESLNSEFCDIWVVVVESLR